LKNAAIYDALKRLKVVAKHL